MKHVEIKQVGSVVVLTPLRNLMGGDECEELRQAALAAAEQGNRALVLDLSQVEHMNSAGLGELVGIYASYKKREGRAVLANLHKRVKDLIILVHLIRVFEVYDSVEEAIASFVTAGTPQSP